MGGDCEDEDAYRCLDTMQRLCRVMEKRPNGDTYVGVADHIKVLRDEAHEKDAESREVSDASQPQAAMADAPQPEPVQEEPQFMFVADLVADLAADLAAEPAPSAPTTGERQPRGEAASAYVKPASVATAPATPAPALGQRDEEGHVEHHHFKDYAQVDMEATKSYSTEKFIYAVLRAEAPIHWELVAERLAVHKGYLKVDKHVKAESNSVLNKVPARD